MRNIEGRTILDGADISHWQGLDFDISNLDFVICKATEGVTFDDSTFVTNIERGLAQGKCVGAYHFARPDNNTAIEEAKHFVEVVKPYVGNCLLALDWEGDAWNYPLTWIREWLDAVYDMTGVRPLLYCNRSKVHLMQNVLDGNYGLWVARWRTANVEVQNEQIAEKDYGDISPYPFAAIWQYWNRPYDKDVFYGTAETWQKYCNSDKGQDVINPLPTNKCDCAICRALRNAGLIE